INNSIFDFLDLSSDRKQRIAEFIQLSFSLRLCRLDHQGTSYRERNRWCMVSIVHQSFRNIFYLHPNFFESSAIDDHLVRCSSLGSCVKYWEMILQSFLDVVSI